jgi:hypothetical protein
VDESGGLFLVVLLWWLFVLCVWTVIAIIRVVLWLVGWTIRLIMALWDDRDPRTKMLNLMNDYPAIDGEDR